MTQSRKEILPDLLSLPRNCNVRSSTACSSSLARRCNWRVRHRTTPEPNRRSTAPESDTRSAPDEVPTNNPASDAAIEFVAIFEEPMHKTIGKMNNAFDYGTGLESVPRLSKPRMESGRHCGIRDFLEGQHDSISHLRRGESVQVSLRAGRHRPFRIRINTIARLSVGVGIADGSSQDTACAMRARTAFTLATDMAAFDRHSHCRTLQLPCGFTQNLHCRLVHQTNRHRPIGYHDGKIEHREQIRQTKHGRPGRTASPVRRRVHRWIHEAYYTPLHVFLRPRRSGKNRTLRVEISHFCEVFPIDRWPPAVGAPRLDARLSTISPLSPSPAPG